MQIQRQIKLIVLAFQQNLYYNNYAIKHTERKMNNDST